MTADEGISLGKVRTGNPLMFMLGAEGGLRKDPWGEDSTSLSLRTSLASEGDRCLT